MSDQMIDQDKIRLSHRFLDIDKKSLVMVPMSHLPAGCSKHGDQQPWRQWSWKLDNGLTYC